VIAMTDALDARVLLAEVAFAAQCAAERVQASDFDLAADLASTAEKRLTDARAIIRALARQEGETNE